MKSVIWLTIQKSLFDHLFLEGSEQESGSTDKGGRHRLEDNSLSLQVDYFDVGSVDQQVAPHTHEGVGDAQPRCRIGNLLLKGREVYQFAFRTPVGIPEVGVVVVDPQVEHLLQVDDTNLVARF